MYRNQAAVKEDMENPVKIFKYIECDSTVCPTCGNKSSSNIARFEECNPIKKAKISGFLWWKVYCPLDTWHYHVKCSVCKAEWIMPGYPPNKPLSKKREVEFK